MEEENSDDDVFSIDWSETAYMLPEPHLITEKSFNEHVWKFSYKEYFNFIRDIRLQSPEESNKQSEEQSNELSQETSTSQSYEKSNIQKQSMEKANEQWNKRKELSLNKKTNINTDTCEVYDHKFYTNYHLLTTEPRKSNISVKDRLFYHDFLKPQSQMNKGQKAEMRMKNLLTRIHAEQNEYQQFLHHSASNNIKNYLYLDDKVKNYVVNSIYDAISKLLQPPQKKFKMLRQINLEQLPAPTNPFFMFVRRVHEEGIIPKYNLPQTDTKLSSNATLLTDKKDDRLSDDTILALCMSEAVEVYMSSAALIAIMEGLVVDTREWLISLEIKEVEIGKEHKQKILMIRDPLPRRVISSREVNNHYYKNVLKLFTQNIHVSSEKDSTQAHEDDSCEEELGVPGENLIIDIEEDDQEGIQKEGEGESNVHVNLFSLSDLNILLETTVDQYDNTSQTTFQISQKCEYQHVVGFEQFSRLDLCRLWWDSHISNTDWIICSRVDIWNDVITRNDKYTRDILCPPACPYNPTYFCNHLYFILNELRSLSPGEYILEHAVGDNCIKVFQENDCGVTYEMIYKDVLNKKELIVELVSPWLPIDTTILTDSFMRNEWIPCLFSQFQKWSGRKKVENKKQRVKRNVNRKWNKSTRKDILDFNYVYPDTNAVPTEVVSNRTVTSYEDVEF